MVKRSLEERLKQKYDNWNHIYTYGGQDLFWSDGCNLNLVRNHISHIKREMEEVGELTETYYRENPPEVDMDYMARSDEIRESAKKSLEIYKNNDDYQYLCKIVNTLTENQIKDTCIRNVIGYVIGLKQFIEDDDLVAMRRHERPGNYIESFDECRKKVEKVLNEKPVLETANQLQGQMNIMDFLGGAK